MKPRFADSAYFIALLNPRDSLHEEALRLFESENTKLITTEWVLCEVAASFSQPVANRSLFGLLLTSLEESADAEVVQATHDLFDKGCSLYLSRKDKGWSLTDCCSFIVMADYDLTEALTADHHFEQAGFTVLMKAGE